MSAKFLRHEGFLGAVGAFLKVHPMTPPNQALTGSREPRKVCCDSVALCPRLHHTTIVPHGEVLFIDVGCPCLGWVWAGVWLSLHLHTCTAAVKGLAHAGKLQDVSG